MPVEEFQYKVDYPDYNEHGVPYRNVDDEAMLNKLGAEGWELVAIFEYTFYLKRKVQRGW